MVVAQFTTVSCLRTTWDCDFSAGGCKEVKGSFGVYDSKSECQSFCGGVNCFAIPYNSSDVCSNPTSIPVSTSACCPAGFPYYCSTSGSCFATCSAAENSGCDVSISFGTGQSGGGGGGGNCSFTPFSGTANCNTGFVAVSSTTCCPGSSPYYCSSTGNCYSSCEIAESVGCGNIVFGSTSGGGGGSQCTWSYTGSLQVTTVWGQDCGDPQSMSLQITNNYPYKVKIFTCIQRTNGTYSAAGDVTGTDPGQTRFIGYVCSATGQYTVNSEKWDVYVANNYCSSPGCN